MAAAATSNDGKETATPTRGAVLEAKMIAAEEKKTLAVAKKEQAAAKRAADAHARKHAGTSCKESKEN